MAASSDDVSLSGFWEMSIEYAIGVRAPPAGTPARDQTTLGKTSLK